MENIESNGLSQAIALRKHYLPHEDDSDINLARAIWLNKQYFENLATAVASGIAKVF
ncbi:hypothetical protein EV694_1260 [Volucribacter psittacicida]|uniref:Uncharacterized protein n=1 Tax=Volucribacter psittacicida TaxID=203482 RepID=A0A4R1FVD0_9PAST|nr:hypothetical protein [Volucribacter psittacicida]TCJ98833.1 hypothetical protein EV694_1260 [Volucribacter psittacicida]